jgi:RNA polymerase sigma-70 factor (ECF subfamily)
MGEATPSRPVPIHELLSHVAWVRRLATELVAGAADAEDVAQETWRHALERPPRHVNQLRHWLALVARNAARQLRRATLAREVHEARVVPSPPEPSSAELVARAQLQRHVVDAVLGLEASYREVILARFFDDQKPSRIAARLDIPVETVKTRLKRGLELVRGRLVAARAGPPARRELAQALAPLFAMRALGVTGRVATAWKCAALVVGAAALAFVVSQSTGTLTRSLASASDISSETATTTTVDPLAAARTSDELPDVGGEQIAAEPAGPLLHGFILDASGTVVPEATITWRVGESVDQLLVVGGEYVIAGLEGGVVPFRVEAKGLQIRDVTLELGEGVAEWRHDFTLEPSIVLPIRIATAGETSLLSGETEPSSTLPTFCMSVVVTERPLPASLPATSASFHDESSAAGRAFLFGGGRMPRGSAPDIAPGTDGVLEASHLPVEATLLLREVVLARSHVTTADSSVVFTVDPGSIDRAMGGLKCTCIDAESHAPLAGTRVEWSTMSEGGSHAAAKDDGTIAVRSLLPGWFDVVLTSPGHERWNRHVLVQPGETTDLGVIALDRELTITGTITDGRGRPAGAEFTVRRLDGYVRGQPFFSHDYFGSGEAGKLQLGGFGRGRYVVQGSAPFTQSRNESAALFVVDLTSGRSPAPLDLRLAPETSVHVAPHLAPGERLFAELRTSAGDLVHADQVVDGGFYASLPAGDYEVALFELPPEGPALRSIRFRANGPQLLVEFDARSAAPAKLSTPDPALERVGWSHMPAPTIPIPPTARTGKTPTRFVVGKVVDRDGAAIGSAVITVTSSAGGSLRTMTHRRGDFALAGVESGAMRIKVSAQGFIEPDPRDLTTPDPTPVVRFVLERATRVRVTLTDLDGAPLRAMPFRELQVFVTREAPAAESWSGAAPRCSKWEPSSFEREFVGTLEIRMPLPVSVNVVSGRTVVATTRLMAAVEELTLAVDPAKLSGGGTLNPLPPDER